MLQILKLALAAARHAELPSLDRCRASRPRAGSKVGAPLEQRIPPVDVDRIRHVDGIVARWQLQAVSLQQRAWRCETHLRFSAATACRRIKLRRGYIVMEQRSSMHLRERHIS